MAGNLSLTGSIRTCKVAVGNANRVQSDRFFNPANNLCIQPNEFDSAGRPSCPYSLRTTAPGCNSAAERILIENDLRPKYSQYISLDVDGITNGGLSSTTTQYDNSVRNQFVKNTPYIGGNFGVQMSAHVSPSGGMMAYERGMAQNAENRRRFDAMNSMYASHAGKSCSGM